jgi:hypothetical protein
MESLGLRPYQQQVQQRSSTDELESAVAYEAVGLRSVNGNGCHTNGNGNGNESGDDDPILTATITFDVTVDPNGQVISTSEGQIIAEGIHQPIDGRTLNLLEHNPIPIAQITSGQINGGSGIQADSLTSLNRHGGIGLSAGQVDQRHSKVS